MLNPRQPLAVYLANHLVSGKAKMGYGVIRYSPNPITCVIDPEHAGKALRSILPILPRDCPIVADIRAARSLGSEVMVLGLAPLGGRLPTEWQPDIDAAIASGMSIVNGLHEQVMASGRKLLPDQWIWNIRQEPPGLSTATGAAAKLDNRRVLMIGTDMAIGKMTAGLEMHRTARERGIDAGFIATGQIGITITGRGVPLDAIRLDFAAGSIEQQLLETPGELVIVEGQGSLLHPSSSATLPLLRGSSPTHLVLCHRAGQQSLKDFADILIPPLDQVATLYEELAAACGVFKRPKVVAIALNTQNLDDAEARAAVDACEQKYQLPVTDVCRFGADPLVDVCMQ